MSAPPYRGDSQIESAGIVESPYLDRTARQFLAPGPSPTPDHSRSASPSWPRTSLNTRGPLDCALVGRGLLSSSFFNKGSAFSLEERKEFMIDGLLPPAVHSLEKQIRRAYEQFTQLETPILQNAFLQSLRDQNEVFQYYAKMNLSF